MFYAESKKSTMVVRAKVPWERNAPGLIAVALDVESILESVAERMIDEDRDDMRCMSVIYEYRSKREEKREWNDN